MIYYVNPRAPKPTYPTLIQLLTGEAPKTIHPTPRATVTYKRTSIDPPPNAGDFNLGAFIAALRNYCETFSATMEKPRASLYRTFSIPKRSGGLREINAPNEELSYALITLKSLFAMYIGDHYHHCAAHAYVNGRSSVTAVKVHQQAESEWFAKFDFKNFFGSTTLEFLLSMCSIIYPLNLVMENEEGKTYLSKALELCFLNGGLPQGTQMSPFLTNLMMIPIDHELLSYAAAEHSPHLVYTRYADDITISCKYSFNFREVEARINNILGNFGAPFRIKPEKTHYGNNKGSNWILGLMLNKDNQITVGYENKKEFKSMLCNYICSFQQRRYWDVGEVMKLQGKISYFRSIEPGYIDYLIRSYNEKFHSDIMRYIKMQLRGEV